MIDPSDYTGPHRALASAIVELYEELVGTRARVDALAGKTPGDEAQENGPDEDTDDDSEAAPPPSGQGTDTAEEGGDGE